MGDVDADTSGASHWVFAPIARAYPHPDGSCAVQLADGYLTDWHTVDRIGLMLATAMAGVEVSRLQPSDGATLLIKPGKYHQNVLEYSASALNEMLAKWLGSPVVGLERHPTLPLVWVLAFEGVNLHRHHLDALTRIRGVMGVAVENAVVYGGQVALLYVPSLGVSTPDDAAASADLMEIIRQIFDFDFRPPEDEPLAPPISAPPATAEPADDASADEAAGPAPQS